MYQVDYEGRPALHVTAMRELTVHGRLYGHDVTRPVAVAAGATFPCIPREAVRIVARGDARPIGWTMQELADAGCQYATAALTEKQRGEEWQAAVTAASCRGEPISLTAADASDERKWIQVARAGKFEGHHQGPFEFTADTFDTIVDNFRNHPAYRVGPDGVGRTDVVAYDFHHASEADPARGDIASMGAPAQAWAQELEVRQGAGGVAELWALTRYLEPARTYVREGRYKSTSVAVWFDAKDAVTGEDVGPTLTSIAFTNSPFLKGMQPIAASAATNTETTPMQPIFANAPGRNPTEKALNYLRAQPQNAHLGLEELHTKACELVRPDYARRLAANLQRSIQMGRPDPEPTRAPFALTVGRNAIEKAMNFIRAQPGNACMSHEDLHVAACALARQYRGAA